ncbi:MAG: glycoside hydrolase family 15 protein [Bacteroidales bacterium]
MQNLDYGVIGNSKSAAMISKDGSLAWACMPEFDSPSVFGKILDKEKGGSFDIIVDDTYQIHQEYIKRTNILKTKFQSGEDAFEIIDFMPRYKLDDNTYNTPPEIIRYFRLISGQPVFRIRYDPKLQYATGRTNSVSAGRFIKSYTHTPSYDSLYLYSDIDDNNILASTPIQMVSNHYFIISYNQKLITIDHDWVELEMERTKVYWLDWIHRTRDFRLYQNEIERSALVLKLLAYQKSGAIIAAITTSIPEKIGAERNWDYRFSWIRDSSMIIKTLINLNHYNVARRFMDFILNLVTYKDDMIQIMYGIRGEKKLTETTLEHLEGYQGSKPVRIGNDAYHQKQNDIYGVLLDVIYQHMKINHITLNHRENLWTITRSILKSVRDNWDKPDKSIWEIRSQSKHFTFSKVLSWVAFDRGVKIARLLKQNYYAEWWTEVRETIKDNILEYGWNNEVQAFTQAYGSTDMDASNLLMERYGFVDATDPKYISTVKETKKQLLRNGLMYRYRNPDDFGTPEVSFSICTFWMITSLYKIGEKKEAKNLFDRMLTYGNHVGLFSEDMDFDSKQLLGNFPQGYSHLALIESAIILAGEESKNEL